jgi:O-antigen ligase
VALGRAIEDLQPIYDRVNLYKLSYQMFLDKPIAGFGFETFQKYSPDYFNEISGIRFTGVQLAAHDTFVAILVELGIIGFATYVGILFLIMKRSFFCFTKTPKKSRKLVVLIICFWAASIHYFINSVFIDIRYFTFLNSIWFIFAAIVENKTSFMTEHSVSE